MNVYVGICYILLFYVWISICMYQISFFWVLKKVPAKCEFVRQWKLFCCVLTFCSCCAGSPPPRRRRRPCSTRSRPLSAPGSATCTPPCRTPARTPPRWRAGGRRSRRRSRPGGTPGTLIMIIVLCSLVWFGLVRFLVALQLYISLRFIFLLIRIWTILTIQILIKPNQPNQAKTK